RCWHYWLWQSGLLGSHGSGSVASPYRFTDMSPSSAVCFSRCWLVLVLLRSFFTATAPGTMKTPIASKKNNPFSRLITSHNAKHQTLHHTLHHYISYFP